jgi:hypothetical protein
VVSGLSQRDNSLCERAKPTWPPAVAPAAPTTAGEESAIGRWARVRSPRYHSSVCPTAVEVNRPRDM